ncbi:MAG: glycosyltransferase [Verrucomicrobia bacterium]|nr:glycosyltransferase [Verrucomicrobiota bacterium]
MKNSGRQPSIDLVIERQWHIGIHAQALEGWLDYRILGGFPRWRYEKLGIPLSRLICRPWPALYNKLRQNLHANFLPRCSDSRFLAKWVSRRGDLARYVNCYATAYRWLFPALAHAPHILILERGSAHPEEISQKVSRGFQEAGLRSPAGLCAFSEEAKAGLHAHFVVAGSQMIFDSYKNRSTPPERILKIPYGVDVDAFPLVQRPDREGPVRLALVGILGVRKGLGRLVRIADWAHRRGISLEFHLVGPFEPEAKRILRNCRSPWIHHGVKKGADLVNVLHQADLYILPSYEEGFGISVLEAMATGLPAIISTATGAKEALTEDTDGVILETFSDQELDSRFHPILQDQGKRRKMGQAASQKVRSSYSLKNYRDHLRTEYTRMFSIVDNAGQHLPSIGELIYS